MTKLGAFQCPWKSVARKGAAFFFFWPVSIALGQTTGIPEGPAVQSGFSVSVPGWLVDALKDLAVMLGGAWTYLMGNSSAVLMLSVVVAAIAATAGVLSQRQMTRMQETFKTIRSGIWDKDFIEAKRAFRVIRNDMESNKVQITKFRKLTNEATAQEIKDSVSLNAIMNEYENMALGIKNHILDEAYLFSWMRGSTIDDWISLRPLVLAYRTGEPKAYVEFQQLAETWDQNRSLRRRNWLGFGRPAKMKLRDHPQAPRIKALE